MVLDGAMGTMVQELAGADAGLCDLLNLSDPLLIGGIHARYLEAGANIIETNTFSANRLTLEGHGFGDRVAEINLRGAQIAREQADRFNALDRGKPRYVAGVLGPGSKAAGFYRCGTSGSKGGDLWHAGRGVPGAGEGSARGRCGFVFGGDGL